MDYCGSSLKFYRVAKGRAHFYARRGRPTMEWDTAAGHAILTSAGGKVVDWDLNPLVYGKAGFKNPGLIEMHRSTPDYDEMWRRLGRKLG